MSLTINSSSDRLGARMMRASIPLYWVAMAGAALILAAALFLNPAPADGPVAGPTRMVGIAGLALLTFALIWLGLVPPPRTTS